MEKKTFLTGFDLPDSPRPIAVIGAGGIVKDAHLPAYKKAGFEVMAIYDIEYSQAMQLAEEYGIPNVCKNLDDLISFAKKYGCLYDMAVPASVILSVLLQLPDGAGVLIQKPMGEDLGQARKILDLCREKRFVAGVNFQLRHAPYVQLAKQMIENGDIGELHDIDVRMNVDTPWHRWEFLYGLPRVEILYHSIHYLDMVRYFLGEPVGVFAKSTGHPLMKQLSSIRSSIIMDYGQFVRANININHGHQFGLKHQESYFKFEGTQGAIKIRVGVYLDYPKGFPDGFEYISLKDKKGWRRKKLHGTWFPDAFIGPMVGLMCKVNDSGYTYVNSVEDAIHTMELVEACYECSEGKSGAGK